MTLEVDPCSEVSLIHEKLGDARVYGDFSKGVARDCDAITHLEDNEIDKDGEYGSYIMVNGSDAVCVDSIHVDLNKEGEQESFGADSIEIDPEFEVSEPRIKNENSAKSLVSEESGEVGQVVEKSIAESASDSQKKELDVRNNVSDGVQKQGEENEMEYSEKVEEISNSQHSVRGTADYRGKEKHENMNRLDSNGTVGEHEISMTEVEDQNGDVGYEADDGHKSNASPNANDEDNAYGKNNFVLKENQLDENGEDFVNGQSGEEEADLEENFDAISTNEAHTVLERDYANGVDAACDKRILILEENHLDENEEAFVVGQSREEEDDLVKTLGTVSTNEDNLLLEIENTDNSLCNVKEDCLAARHDQDEDPQTAEVVSASDDSEVASDEKNCTIFGVCDTITDMMAEAPSEEHDVVLDNSLEKSTATDLCHTEDKDAQAEGSVSGEKRDGLPASSNENTTSNTSVTVDSVLTSKKILEGNRQLENTERTPSVMVGSVEINCKEMFPSLPFNNAAIKSFLKAKTPASQELSSSAIEDKKLVEEVKNVSESIDNPNSSCLLDANVEAKPANGTVEEAIQSSISGDDDGKPNSLSDGIEFENNGSKCQEAKVTDEIHRDVCVATVDHPSHETAEVQNLVAEVGSGPFYLVRFPRYEDDIIREKIKQAQSLVDQKTRIRESLQAQIKTTKATLKELGSNLDAAKLDGKAARDLLKAKRKEIDSAQSLIEKAKNAMSIDDIGIRINKLEHTIAHETLPLKEEKQLVREIKQWTQLRDQLSLDAGKQSELQLALDQKDQIEERLTLLRKEMDLVKDNVLKADARTMSVKKMYDEERVKFNELQSQFEAANKIRQEAYAHLQCLKQPYREKLNYFGKYKNDIEEAKNLALSRDRVKLQGHAAKQVETLMERWNNDGEFRKEYTRCNTRSTLRRLGTFDGRSLGPDEEPPVLNNIVKGRAATDLSSSLGSTVEQDRKAVHVETVKDNLKPAKVEEKKDSKSKSKNPVAVVVAKPNKQKTVSMGVEVAEVRDGDGDGVEVVDLIEDEEEDELAKRAEELRKEEEGVRLKEQLKLEEKAKAMEALERKKRLAEKARARAAIKAQKMAEEREKEKEKKAMKKERKKAVGGGEARNDGADEEESAVGAPTPTETQQESDVAEKPKTTAKKPQKRSQFSKQSKSASIPPAALRKRGKRKMEPWMWILFTVVVVAVALFFLGNGGSVGMLGMMGKP